MTRFPKIALALLMLGSLVLSLYAQTAYPQTREAGDPRLQNLYGPQPPRADGVTFRYYIPEAGEVRIAGDWSGWETQSILSRGKSPGFFEITLPLFEQKRYRYKLIVDGIWQRDYANPNKERMPSGDVISWFEIKQAIPQHRENPKKIAGDIWRFYYRNPTAQYVRLVGSFNGFNPNEAAMKRDSSGVWVAEVQVLPGEHAYCFVVDGVWKLDPEHISKIVTRFGQEFNHFIAE